MTKMLPIVLVAMTAVITTAIVQAIYGAFWLGRRLIDGPASSYDWSRSLAASGIATAVVLVAGIAALRLLAAKPGEASEECEVQAPDEAARAGLGKLPPSS